MKNPKKGKMSRKRNRSPYAKYKKRAWDYSEPLQRFIAAVKGTGSVDEARRSHNAFIRRLRTGGNDVHQTAL